jgi:hypothetical protein
MRLVALTLLAAMAASGPAVAQSTLTASPAPAARNWGATLADDVRAMDAAIGDSHPGPVDDQNPAFRRQAQEGRARALERARTADSQGGWWWALREYEATFADGHLALSTAPDTPALPSQWPGFLTRFQGREQIVATHLDEAGLPPTGARLVSCDGRPAWRLAEENVGRFRGRWALASQRSRHGPRLFIDASNPWIRRPATCIFEVAGQKSTYRLAWRTMSQEEIGSRLAEAQQSFRAPIERRAFGADGLWISAGAFDGDPGSGTARALRELVDGLNSDANLRHAPVIVLDLRGNGGGSSAWGREMATAIWGESWVTAHEQNRTYVEWRASAENLAALSDFETALKADPASDPAVVSWVGQITRGLSGAIAAGNPLWRQTADEAAAPPPSAAPAVVSQFPGRVYLLTDAACASACLDTVDLWKSLGAVQVGGETSADTLYMELRVQPLPSGLAVLSLPMKVYRGRARGINEPHRPAHAYAGDLSDTPALEAWIRSL